MKKSCSPTINHDEWLGELLKLRAMHEDGGGLTVSEMIAATGLRADVLHKKLRIAKNAGKLIVMRKPMERIDGIVSHVRSYKLKR